MQDESGPYKGRPKEKGKYHLPHGENTETKFQRKKIIKINVTVDDGSKIDFNCSKIFLQSTRKIPE